MPTLKQYINQLAVIGAVLIILCTGVRAAVGYENVHVAFLIMGCVFVALSVMGMLELYVQRKRIEILNPLYCRFGPRMAQIALFGVAGVGILSPHVYSLVNMGIGFVLAGVLLMIMDECSNPRKFAGAFTLALVYGGVLYGSVVLSMGPYEDLKAGFVALLCVGSSWVLGRILAYVQEPVRQLVI